MKIGVATPSIGQRIGEFLFGNWVCCTMFADGVGDAVTVVVDGEVEVKVVDKDGSVGIAGAN